MNTAGRIVILLFISYGVLATATPVRTYFWSVSTTLSVLRFLRIQRSDSYPAYEKMARLYHTDTQAYTLTYRREIAQMRVSGLGLTLFSLLVLWFFYI